MARAEFIFKVQKHGLLFPTYTQILMMSVNLLPARKSEIMHGDGNNDQL